MTARGANNRPAEPCLFVTSLEPPETSRTLSVCPSIGVDGLPVSLSETFRHSGWHRERKLVHASLVRTSQTLARRKAFEACGHRAWVYQSADDPRHFRMGGSSCRDRWCLPCAQERARIIASNIAERLPGQRSRFLTLTLQSSDTPLADQLQRLYAAFAKLRKTKCFRKGATGGVATIEVTFSPERQQWHPHLHVLLSGKYIPHSEIRAEWLRCTGDSTIVHINLVRSKDAAARYVAKYVSKPLSNSFVNRPDRLDEIISAMKGRRLCLTFGDWRGVSLTNAPDPGEWILVGSLDDVCDKALRGDTDALAVIDALAGQRAHDLMTLAARSRPPPRQEPPVDVQLLLPPIPFNAID